MSLKGSTTTADFLPWNDMLVLVQKLSRDEEVNFALLIALGCYTGLRISDIKALRWADVKDELILTEKKTRKKRKLHLHDDLLSFLEPLRPKDEKQVIYPLSLQYTNRKLKKIARDYNLNVQFSTHSFRKTFGRRIWAQNGYSEKSLILLGQIFNHSSVAITKRYLGIRDKEIKDIYLNL